MNLVNFNKLMVHIFSTISPRLHTLDTASIEQMFYLMLCSACFSACCVIIFLGARMFGNWWWFIFSDGTVRTFLRHEFFKNIIVCIYKYEIAIYVYVEVAMVYVQYTAIQLEMVYLLGYFDINAQRLSRKIVQNVKSRPRLATVLIGSVI
jgi:hypothetical protein